MGLFQADIQGSEGLWEFAAGLGAGSVGGRSGSCGCSGKSASSSNECSCSEGGACGCNGCASKMDPYGEGLWAGDVHAQSAEVLDHPLRPGGSEKSYARTVMGDPPSADPPGGWIGTQGQPFEDPPVIRALKCCCALVHNPIAGRKLPRLLCGFDIGGGRISRSSPPFVTDLGEFECTSDSECYELEEPCPPNIWAAGKVCEEFSNRFNQSVASFPADSRGVTRCQSARLHAKRACETYEAERDAYIASYGGESLIDCPEIPGLEPCPEEPSVHVCGPDVTEWLMGMLLESLADGQAAREMAEKLPSVTFHPTFPGGFSSGDPQVPTNSHEMKATLLVGYVEGDGDWNSRFKEDWKTDRCPRGNCDYSVGLCGGCVRDNVPEDINFGLRAQAMGIHPGLANFGANVVARGKSLGQLKGFGGESSQAEAAFELGRDLEEGDLTDKEAFCNKIKGAELEWLPWCDACEDEPFRG